MCCAGQSTPPWAQGAVPHGWGRTPAEHPAEPQLLCCVMGLNRDNAYSRCSAKIWQGLILELLHALLLGPALGQPVTAGLGTALLPSGQCRLTPLLRKSRENHSAYVQAVQSYSALSRWVMSWAPPGAPHPLVSPPPSPSKLVHLVTTSSVPFRS